MGMEPQSSVEARLTGQVQKASEKGDGWKSPSGTNQMEVGTGRSKGNNGEDTELTGTAPECHTCHGMLASQSMARTPWLNPVLSVEAIHLSMMRGHNKLKGKGCGYREGGRIGNIIALYYSWLISLWHYALLKDQCYISFISGT